MALRVVLLTTFTTLRLLACNAQAVTNSNDSTPAGPSSWTPLIANGPSLNVWVRNDTILGPEGTLWSSLGHDSLSNAANTWSSFIRIDGKVYQWLGQQGQYEGPATTQVTTTSTSTTIRQSFPSISLITRFLTPPPSASPDLLFSYVVSQVTSSDGAAHDVQILSTVASPTAVTVSDSSEQTISLWEAGGKTIHWAARERSPSDSSSAARGTVASFPSSANATVVASWAENGALPASTSDDGHNFAVISFDLGQISTIYARKEQEAAMVFVSTKSASSHSSQGLLESYDAVASASEKFNRQAASDAQTYVGPNAEAVGQSVRGYRRALAMLDEDAQASALLANSPVLMYSAPSRLRHVVDNLLARNAQDENFDDATSTILLACISNNRSAHSLSPDAYASLKRRADALLQNDTALYPPAIRAFGDLADGISASSNLAVKGIIALKAMGRLAVGARQDQDAVIFENAASNLAGRFTNEYISGNDTNRHVVLSRGNSSSWSSLPNLVYDRVLGLNSFPETFYSQQQAFLRTIIGPHGFPLDSRSQLANAYQQSQLAAVYPDLRAVLTLSGPYYAFTGPYDAWHGTFASTLSAPVQSPVGAAFTSLVMPGIDANSPSYDLAGQLTDAPQSEADNNPFYSMRAAWAALLAAIGIVVTLGTLAALWTWISRRRKQRQTKKEDGGSKPEIEYAKVDQVVAGVVGEQADKV